MPVEKSKKERLFALDNCAVSVQSVADDGCKLRRKMAICQQFSTNAP